CAVTGADGHRPVLHRLAEHLEQVGTELGQLVQEQHAAVGRRYVNWHVLAASTAGASIRRTPASRATIALGSRPAVWRSAPSSESSPRKTAPTSGSAGTCSLARSTPIAIGRPCAPTGSSSRMHPRRDRRRVSWRTWPRYHCR